MNLPILGIPATIAVVTASASAQDGMLRAWMDAPETVVAGEPVTVTVRASFLSDIIDMDEAYFGAILTSIDATTGSTLIHSFSSAYGEFVVPIHDGTPDESGIRDIWAWQAGHWGFNQNIDQSPVMTAFSFDVATRGDTLGEIQLDFASTNLLIESPYLAWFLDFDESNIFVDSTMPNIEVYFEPVTIRVIPTSGTCALLIFVGLGAMRRQRQ